VASTDIPRTPDDVFDARARLQLLQLEARRQMAARLQKGLAATEEPETDSESDDDEEQAPTGAEVPDRWKLLPDGLKLHAWQEECLPRWLETGRGDLPPLNGLDYLYCGQIDRTAWFPEPTIG
jgi:hypothetical protein